MNVPTRPFYTGPEMECGSALARSLNRARGPLWALQNRT